MERSRDEGTECERAWTPLLLFRWPVDGDGVQCFLKWPPADKHVPFPAQLSVSDIEPDQGKYLPPLPVFSLTIKKINVRSMRSVILVKHKSTFWQWRLGLTNTFVRNDNNNQISGVVRCYFGKTTTLGGLNSIERIIPWFSSQFDSDGNRYRPMALVSALIPRLKMSGRDLSRCVLLQPTSRWNFCHYLNGFRPEHKA